MKLNQISISDLIPMGLVTEPGNSDELLVKADSTPGILCLQTEELKAHWTKNTYLVFNVTLTGQSANSVSVLVWSENNQKPAPDFTISFGIHPGLPATIALPLKTFSEGCPVPKRPGRLISFQFGSSVFLDEISRIGLTFSALTGPVEFIVSNFHFADSEPDYTIPDELMIDEMGQWIQSNWEAKTSSTEELKSCLVNELKKTIPKESVEGLSDFGGYKDSAFEASGFFRTHHDGRRWWLVDPEGYAFFSSGLNVVGCGVPANTEGIEKLFSWLPSQKGPYTSCWGASENIDNSDDTSILFNFSQANMIRVFGEQWFAKWSAITRNRMIEWGFNTIGNWSDHKFIHASGLPYVMMMEDFPTTENCIFRDFPDVFSKEYEDKCEIFASQLKICKQDRLMIGYFMNNEPNWAYVPRINLAEYLLASDEPLRSKEDLADFLKSRYRKIMTLNAAWGKDFDSFESLKQPIRHACSFSEAAAEDLKDFSILMLKKWIGTAVTACRKVDPNHLNLGMRWASAALQNPWRFEGSEYLDVLSMNRYADDPTDILDKASAITNKPILIGEFHHGSRECGHAAYGTRWTNTEAERGRAYCYYVQRAAHHTSCIGAHYFCMDDDPVLGRFDGEDFHHGVVDVCHKPYSDFVLAVSRANRSLPKIASGKEKCAEKYPEGMVSSIPYSF